MLRIYLNWVFYNLLIYIYFWKVITTINRSLMIRNKDPTRFFVNNIIMLILIYVSRVEKGGILLLQVRYRWHKNNEKRDDLQTNVVSNRNIRSTSILHDAVAYNLSFMIQTSIITAIRKFHKIFFTHIQIYYKCISYIFYLL